MPGSDHGFFRRVGGCKVRDLVDLVYEVAYFWKCPPQPLFDCKLKEILEMKHQLNRISNIIASQV